MKNIFKRNKIKATKEVIELEIKRIINDRKDLEPYKFVCFDDDFKTISESNEFFNFQPNICVYKEITKSDIDELLNYCYYEYNDFLKNKVPNFNDNLTTLEEINFIFKKYRKQKEFRFKFNNGKEILDDIVDEYINSMIYKLKENYTMYGKTYRPYSRIGLSLNILSFKYKKNTILDIKFSSKIDNN